MMTVTQRRIGLLLTATVFGSTVCHAHGGIPPRPAAANNRGAPIQLGNYQGNLIQLIPGASPSSAPMLQQFAVSARVSQPEKTSIHVSVTESNPAIESALDILFDATGKTAELTLPGTQAPGPALLKNGNCYSAPSPANLQLCVLSQAITVSARDSTGRPTFSLSLEYFGDLAGPITLETPKNYTLDDAVKQALTKDFATQIQFQQMLQARYTTKSARLNLLPHIGNGTLVALAGGPITTTLGLISVASDLVPFLFPSRWQQAKADSQMSAAAGDAWAIMSGDAGLNVELLAYGIDHDQNEIALLLQDRKDTVVLRDKAKAAEAKGLVPEGTTAHLNSILLSLDDAWDDLAYPLKSEYAALAQAMGMINPEAVTSISVPVNPPDYLDGQNELEIGRYQNLVLGRSIEIRQIDHLIDAAKSSRSADSFNWIDPSADISQALGFGLGSTLKVDKSQVNSLTIQRNQTAALLLSNLENALVRYNHSLDDLGDSKRGLALEQAREDAILNQLESGKAVNDVELTTIPMDKLAWQINGLDAMLDHLSSLAVLNRMLLQGYYSNIDGTTGTTAPYSQNTSTAPTAL